MEQVWFAMLALAQSVRLNPVQRRFDELGEAWDGKPRLDDWLIRYLKAAPTVEGVDISDYLRAAGSRWLLSVVARGYQPGCKVDDMLVLEGRQGARKSSAIRVLAEAVGPSYFKEGFSLSGSKDDKLSLRGRLIVEWGELDGMGRHDRNVFKNFLTLQTDSYRSPYDRADRDWPRTAVFAGSTNDQGYLNDPTGNRRFLPVVVGKAVDIDALTRDAPMLWAEAVVRYKSGARWWLDDNDPADAQILALARREQSKRVGGTFWSEIAETLAERLVRGELYVATGGAVMEASPFEWFRVPQVQAWLIASADHLNEGKGQNQNRNQSRSGVETTISSANWYKVTEGLRLAGWHSQKKHGGVMCWALTPEKRDELFMLHGREVGPAVSDLRRARREEKEGAG